MIKILDFYADWCLPCKQLTPVLEEIIEENHQIIIDKVNIEEEDDLVFKYSVSSIPTLIIFKDDIQVDKIIGALPKAKLMNVLNKYL